MTADEINKWPWIKSVIKRFWYIRLTRTVYVYKTAHNAHVLEVCSFPKRVFVLIENIDSYEEFVETAQTLMELSS